MECMIIKDNLLTAKLEFLCLLISMMRQLTDGQTEREKTNTRSGKNTKPNACFRDFSKDHPLHQSSLCSLVSNRPSISIEILITYNRIKSLKQHAVSALTQHSWATGLRTAGGKEGGEGNFKRESVFPLQCRLPHTHTYTRTRGGVGAWVFVRVYQFTSCGSSSHILLPFFYFT